MEIPFADIGGNGKSIQRKFSIYRWVCGIIGAKLFKKSKKGQNVVEVFSVIHVDLIRLIRKELFKTAVEFAGLAKLGEMAGGNQIPK